MKKISIIIPSLNQGIYIEKTITSLLDQKYPDLEIIVMDGGSSDITIEILKKYDSNIKWISEKDNGQSDAINKGLRLATGEIIGFINSDDFLLPNSLSIISECFEEDGVLWMTGDYLIIDANEKQIQPFIVKYKRFFRNISSMNLLLVTNYIIQPSTFWRKTLLNEIGFFDDSLKYVMDYDFWIRAYQFVNPKIVNQPISAFRIHKKSKGGSQFREQFEEQFFVCKKYTDNLLIRGIHKIHNSMIVTAYSILK